jgi:UDP-N-acetylmuramoyl-tripeptide--D-alanyl-D-alanine ligase
VNSSTAARRVFNGVAVAAALWWRGLLGTLGGVRFISVTGSAGKTTAAALIAASLGAAGRVRRTNRFIGHLNAPHLAARLVLTTTPLHDFCLCEVATGEPGTIARFVRVLRPHIGIVTLIAWDHYKAFHGLDATALEKRVLVETLPADGVAVLNADDPRVAAMSAFTRARVLTFGLRSDAVVRGEDIVATWPERLALTVRHGTDQVRVETRLVGEHFAHAVLAAMAASVAAGIPLAAAAHAVKDVEPVEGRYSVHAVDGVTFIRDDWKAPLWSISAALRFMATARARRKILVLGTISDYPGKASRTYRVVARKGAQVVDRIIFVGSMARHARPAPSTPDADRILTFETLYALDRFLADYLETGDLVLIKGSNRADHLQRLVIARSGKHLCWRPRCGRPIFCARCALRTRSFVPEAVHDHDDGPLAT